MKRFDWLLSGEQVRGKAPQGILSLENLSLTPRFQEHQSHKNVHIMS